MFTILSIVRYLVKMWSSQVFPALLLGSSCVIRYLVEMCPLLDFPCSIIKETLYQISFVIGGPHEYLRMY